MKLRFASLIAVLAMFAALVGCVPPYRQTFEDAGKDKHWTKKQVLAAFAYADRLFWAREIQEGSNQYVIIYGKVPTAKVASQIEVVLKDLDMSLDPNDKEMRQYLDTFKLRADLEREEEITKAQYARFTPPTLRTSLRKRWATARRAAPRLRWLVATI